MKFFKVWQNKFRKEATEERDLVVVAEIPLNVVVIEEMIVVAEVASEEAIEVVKTQVVHLALKFKREKEGKNQ